MAGITVARADDGSEWWRATSREISANQLTATRDRIYSIGLKGTNKFVPTLRAFSFRGQQILARDFPDLADYHFTDIAAVGDSIVILAINSWANADRYNHALVIKLSAEGIVERTATLHFPGARIHSAKRPRIALVEDRLVVTLNSEPRSNVDRNVRNKIGLPRVCYQTRFSTMTKLDPASLQITFTTTFNNFHTNVIGAKKKEIFLGGETYDNCSYRGKAAIFRVPAETAATLYWTDEGMFPSEVRGFSIGDRMHLAINARRSFGISSPQVSTGYDMGDKRALENDSESLEAYLLELDERGVPMRKQYFSTGLALYIQGTVARSKKLIAYGSLGG